MVETDDIGDRIKWLRKEHLRLTQDEFAQHLGDVTRGAVGNWERGQGVKRANIQHISRKFDVSFDWLATGRGKPFDNLSDISLEHTPLSTSGSIPVHGTVAAGVWQEANTLDGLTPHEEVPPTPEYPLEWQIALSVSGASLNKIAQDGDRLICLDIAKSGADVTDGDLVIVERSRMGNQLIERTAKRIRKTMKGLELWPESTHPDFQSPIEYKPDGDEDHNEVRVIAKVLWVLKRP